MLLKYLIKKVLWSFEGNLQKYESHSVWNWSNFYLFSLNFCWLCNICLSYAFSKTIFKWINELAGHGWYVVGKIFETRWPNNIFAEGPLMILHSLYIKGISEVWLIHPSYSSAWVANEWGQFIVINADLFRIDP